ncbi:outer membrane beta-barrel protein [Vibrio comitans]
MKHIKWTILSVALVAGLANASEAGGVTSSDEGTGFFSGITLGAGYAQDNIDGKSLKGYSVFSRGYLVRSWKEYLFTDFRVSTTSKDDADLERYQASLGVDYPYQASENITVKPYLTSGWSWDKLEEGSYKSHDNGFLAAVGVETQFGDHVVTNLGYSEQFSGDLDANQFMLDVGYKFK